MKIFRTDRGKENLNKDVKQLLDENRIHHQTTVGYAPEQNGSVERENQTLVKAVRTILHSR